MIKPRRGGTRTRGGIRVSPLRGLITVIRQKLGAYAPSYYLPPLRGSPKAQHQKWRAGALHSIFDMAWTAQATLMR